MRASTVHPETPGRHSRPRGRWMRCRALLAAIVAFTCTPAWAKPASRAKPVRKARPTVLNLPRPAQPEWFGLYLMGKKVGYLSSWVGIEMREGRRVLVARMDTTLSATLGTQKVERSRTDEKTYEAKPSGRLLAFRSRRAGDGGEHAVAGSCTPQGCSALLTGTGQREERKLPAFRETAEQADAARLAAAWKGTLAGEQIDLEELRVKQMKDRYVGTGLVAAGGVQEKVAVVEELEQGDRAATRLSIASDGRVVEMGLGNAVVVRPEPEETAKRLENVDMFSMTRVALPAALPRDVPGRVCSGCAASPSNSR